MNAPTRSLLLPLTLLLCLAVHAQAQAPGAPGAPAAPAPPPPPPAAGLPPQLAPAAAPAGEMGEVQQMLVEMGMPREKACMMALMLSTAGDDAATMLPMLMMMGDGGGGGGDMGGAIFMMMLTKMASAGKAAAFGYWHDDANQIAYVIDEGVLYKINLGTMEIVAKLQYKAPKTVNIAERLAALSPALADARDRATQSACLANCKQLGLGALMYAQDHDEILPTKNWVKDLAPYLKNDAVFICPARQAMADIGYAMNEQLIGANWQQVKQPTEVVLFFETGLGGENPVGGPAAIPPGGVHNGGIDAVYLDGHAKWLPVDEAQRLLAQPLQ